MHLFTIHTQIKSKVIFLTLFTTTTLFSQTVSENSKLIKILESQVGSYYSAFDNKELILKLDSFLVTRTEKINEQFRHELSKPITFEFYENENPVLCNCGQDTNKIKGIYERLGCAKPNYKIQMVSFNLEPTIDSIYNKWGGFHKAMLHQYIHVLLYDLVGEKKANNIPLCFMEGLAVYFAQQIKFDRQVKDIISYRTKSYYVPPVRELLSDKKIKKYPNIHHWSFLFCKYIIDKYGWDRMLEIINNPKSFYKIMEKYESGINIEWYDYLTKKYPDN